MPKRTYDIDVLDNHIRLLKEDAVKLRKQMASSSWASTKADKLDAIAQILLNLRQDQQMQGAASDDRIDEATHRHSTR